MFKIRHLLPLAALAAVLSYAVPSSAETIIDEWANVKAPSPPELCRKNPAAPSAPHHMLARDRALGIVHE